ncbi:hypothetical protein PE066_03475 [Ramlibacter tataouinensis]|uniref:hypothetical protein n=1 Tax=Ramlibacter tataouinensis TaxID=94132 RepID=UPI0022F3BBEF|nr:hypothetical protein [Ramlibacter tataouinensis]WBY02610.1 hypothetical protein PE066_03475 [Ramlibacter tataouinensis]
MSRLVALPLLLLSFAAFAQAPAVPPPQQDPPLEGRRNQRVEHLTVEDGGSRIDEVRYAGQTQSITVQPKVGEVPAYEVMPATPSRNRIADERQGTYGGGQRFWNVFRF